MAFLNDRVLDFGVNEIAVNGNRFDICSQQPTTYTEAITTYTLGNKVAPTITGPADGTVSGRAVTIGAITDGTVTGNGTATHYAIVDTVNSRLLATQTLASSVAVATGSPFTTVAAEIAIPDPA